MKLFLFFLLILFFNISNILAKNPDWPEKIRGEQYNKEISSLLLKFEKDYKDKKELLKLKEETIKLYGKAVPVLAKVMKESKYPDKNRWIATFMLGKIMGKKSAPFISKFLKHPSWVMRMASLKTLLVLKQDEYAEMFAESLKDNSLIVRIQAIDNINKLQLKKYAPNVWVMLYDKNNYYQNKEGMKRTNIIKKIITTVGDLQFEKALKPLYKMVINKKYDDIFPEIDYALTKITGKKSPNGDLKVKRIFWNRASLSTIVI